MAYFKRSSRYRMLATILAVVLMLWLAVNVPAKVQAQSSSASLSSKLENAFSENAFPRDVASETSIGGGLRCPCLTEDSKPFTALVPASGMGKTIAEYPTVFWYMPKILSEDRPAPAVEFVLRDEKSQEVYSTTYVLVRSREGFVGSPGIMSLTAANPTPLEIGREYRWQLTFRCDSTDLEDRSRDEITEGRLKRVQPDPNLVIRIQQATPEERVSLYADAELWSETVGTLLELWREYPNDKNLAQDWKDLLKSVGLKTISEEPLNYFKLQGTKMP
jgi:hypothetical protein